MTLDDLDTKLEELSQEILANCKKITATEAGLDRRCQSLWVCPEDRFIVTMHPKELNYYGGFEYIDPAFVRSLGYCTLYFEEDRGDDRVTRVFENML